MDKYFELLRYEVNFLLFAIETCHGADIKKQAEDALNYVFYCFFFNKQDPEFYSAVDTLQYYISFVSDEYNDLYPTFYKDISQIFKMIALIKRENSIV